MVALEGSQRSMLLGLMLLATCGLVVVEYGTLMRSRGRQPAERWGGAATAHPLDDLLDRGPAPAPAAAVAVAPTSAAQPLRFGVLKQAHRAGLAAATAPAIATEAAPGPDAEVWLTLDEISAPWMASLAQQNVRPTHPRPRQAAQGPVGSTEGPGYRFGPGPLSTLMTTEGMSKARRPGFVKCIRAQRGPMPSQSVLVEDCGSFDRGHDRGNNRSIPTSLFRWDSSDGKIVLVAADDNAESIAAASTAAPMCLQAGDGDGHGSTVELVGCSDRLEIQQQWEAAMIGGRHKQFVLLRNKYTKNCLSYVLEGRKLVPIVEDCDPKACTQAWTMSAELTVVPEAELTVTPGNVPASMAGSVPVGSAAATVGGKRPLRVLCWILTYPKAHSTKAVAINATWGRKCTKLVFMTTEHYPDLNTVVLDIGGPEDRGRLWNKSREAWTHVYKNHVDEYDWFIKADDDTYVVWDHFADFLSKTDPEDPRYFGRQFNATRGEYYAGGSGIVLSRGALRKLGQAADADFWDIWSLRKNGPEDLFTGNALTKVGIHTEQTVDPTGAQLFLALGPHFEYGGRTMNPKFWFYRISLGSRIGPTCCSERWISTHYASPPQLYLLDDYEEVGCTADMTTWPHLRAPRVEHVLAWL